MGAESPCDTCATSRCCTVFDPELTGPDIARLTAALGVEPSVFAWARPVHTEQAGPDGVRLGTAETWELRLRRTTAGDAAIGEGGARRCIFLLHLGPGLNRCGVYAIRPMICRTFPTAIGRDMVYAGGPPGVCPEGAWEAAVLDVSTIRVTHGAADLERQRWRAFLAAWNALEAQADLAPLERADALALLMRTVIHFEGDESASPAVRFQRALQAALKAPPPQR